jgi:hypothetical protein
MLAPHFGARAVVGHSCGRTSLDTQTGLGPVELHTAVYGLSEGRTNKQALTAG